MGNRFKVGDKVVALQKIPYFFGQCVDDCIRRGEVCTVDGLQPERNAITVREHADRYGAWEENDFITVDEMEKYAGTRNKAKALRLFRDFGFSTFDEVSEVLLNGKEVE